MRRLTLNLLLGLTLLAPLAPAALAGDIPWSSLSPEEQHILSRAREHWEQMPTERQQRLLRGARRWQHMTPEQREQARERWKERHEHHQHRRDEPRQPRYGN